MKDERCTISGAVVVVSSVGILLQGPAGIGKTETLLGLLYRGHSWVADDHITLQKTKDHLIASQNSLGTSLLYLQGIGLVDITHTLKMPPPLEHCALDLIIKLSEKSPNSVELNPMTQTSLLGIPLPLITFCTINHRNLPLLIEIAAKSFLNQKKGYNAALVFEKQQRTLMDKHTP